MRTIHKHPLRYNDTQTTIGTHKGAQPIYVGFDPANIPCVWMEVDTSKPNVQASLYVVGPGHDIPAGTKHCGSFRDQQFIWHIYWKENV